MGRETQYKIYNNNRGRHRKVSIIDDLKIANKIHNNFYNYSLVDYKTAQTKIKIICPVHGVFTQLINDHVNGHGCNKCARDKISNKTIIDRKIKFIEKSNKIHNNFYNYSLVEYKSSSKKVKIICPVHGVFEQTPCNHMAGCICLKCYNESRGKYTRSNTLIFIDAAKQIHNNYYDYKLVNYIKNNIKVKIICPVHGVFEQTPLGHLSGSDCKKCGTITAHKNKIKNYNFVDNAKQIHKEKYDYTKTIYKGILTPVTITCKTHGDFLQIPHTHLKGSGCQKCGCNNSKLEDIIKDILNKHHIVYIPRYKLKTAEKTIELDFYIPSKSLAIEVNGLYWHSENSGKKNRKYHKYKTEECNKRNIKLIHIFEDELISKNLPITISRIKNLLGLTKYKIYARKCEINEITATVKNKFLNKYHIQGEDKSNIKLGAFYKNKLVAVMTFSLPRIALGSKNNKNNTWELCRFCAINGFTIVGIASKLLTHFERLYNPKQITTYADRRWSHGDLYYKLGFNIDHISPPNYWYFKYHELNRLHRYSFRKNILQNKLNFYNSALSEWENMKVNGYDRIWDCGNLVFIKKYTK